MGSKHQKLEKRIAVVPVLLEKKKHRKKGRKKGNRKHTKYKIKRKVYLVTSREQGQWIIPTGKLEKKLSNRRVALLEAFEEAGILGELDTQFKLQVQLQSPCGKHERKTIVFLLHVKRILKCWPEDGQRKRKSVSIKKYAKNLSNKKLRQKLLEL